jgi:hypothetical protein
MAKAASSRGGAPPGRTFWGLHLQPCVQEGHRLDYSRELEADTRIVTAAIGGAWVGGCTRVCACTCLTCAALVRGSPIHSIHARMSGHKWPYNLPQVLDTVHVICVLAYNSPACFFLHVFFFFVACFFPTQRRRPTLPRLATVARG